MSIVSFWDNGFLLSESVITRDYSGLADKIWNNKEEMTFFLEKEQMLLGFCVTANEPLTELFQSPFWVVRFRFANVDTMHGEAQLAMMLDLFEELQKYIEKHRGYYNLRIPSHIVDAVKAYNSVVKDSIFCGGTIEEMISGKTVPFEQREELKVFWADSQYIKNHKELLSQMTFESFKSYQGQYHISPVTQDKAGMIYENWIQKSLEQCDKNRVIVAEHDNRPIGFVTVVEADSAVEGVLSAVDNQFRKFGAYRAMISAIVNDAATRSKAFITSTQFDNFIVQGVWNSIGLKPYYSIYNIHVDKR
ncbi:MAG: GNAT family N-acetyltransferase [Lachnospiraceae bacterium]|nr:GNAT family N-acetyltransferase [Lachnospiraceae bacterium]